MLHTPFVPLRGGCLAKWSCLQSQGPLCVDARSQLDIGAKDSYDNMIGQITLQKMFLLLVVTKSKKAFGSVGTIFTSLRLAMDLINMTHHFVLATKACGTVLDRARSRRLVILRSSHLSSSDIWLLDAE